MPVHVPGHFRRFQRGTMPSDLAPWVERWNEVAMDRSTVPSIRVLRVARASAALWFRMEALDGDGTVRRGRLLMVGAFTQSAWVPIAQSPENVIFFLRPGAVQAMLGRPASEIAHQRWTAEMAFGAEGDALEQRLAAAHSHGARRELMAAFIRQRLARFARPVDRELVDCIRHLRHPSSSADTAAPHGWSVRQLERLCAGGIGMGIKRLSILLRAGDAMLHASRQLQPNWQAIAMDFGFYDQSHLTHAVTHVLGQPPARFHAMIRQRASWVDGMVSIPAAPA
jgi:AraC-like DNA-binding protein